MYIPMYVRMCIHMYGLFGCVGVGMNSFVEVLLYCIWKSVITSGGCRSVCKNYGEIQVNAWGVVRFTYKCYYSRNGECQFNATTAFLENLERIYDHPGAGSARVYFFDALTKAAKAERKSNQK